MINQIQIIFSGSFQCRLATDPSPKDASPISPSTVRGGNNGWTFSYREPPFDRIIRLSNPVDLRRFLAVDPWEDTKVTMIAADRGNGGLTVNSSDQLVGKIVSLGGAKFDADVGNGPTKEALIDFRFSIGQTLVTAEASPAPLSPGIDPPSGNTAWEVEYNKKKRSLLKTFGFIIAPTQPLRYKVLTDQAFGVNTFRSGTWIDAYSRFFKFTGLYPDINLTNVSIASNSGILKEMGDPKQFEWKLDMKFYRFDGDTLTGRIHGTLIAKRP